MKAGFFIWTIQADYTQARLPSDDTQVGMSVALMKVNDGLEYQMYSPEESRHFADEVYRPQGIDWMPWGVARGWNEEVARNEGRLAGQQAAASRSEYILDLEPDPKDYWQGIPGTPRAFCEGYGETSNGLNLRICPDARNIPLDQLREWVSEPIVGIWHPQMYFRAFNEDPDGWFRRGVQPLIDLGVSKDRIYPVLAAYYAATGDPSITPDDLDTDIHYVADNGYPGFALWRRGTLSPEAAGRMQAMPDPFSGSPPVVDPVPPPTGQVTTITIPAGAVLESSVTFTWRVP